MAGRQAIAAKIVPGRAKPMDTPVNQVRLLIVDDDEKLCGLVKEYLEPMGYQVSAAHSGQEGLDRALSGDYDAVLLDVMLPDLDGFEVLRRLRAGSRVPVLMLTARGEETDRIVGLEMGADDYLPKTFSTRELLARLRAVIRRSAGQAPGSDPAGAEAITIGPLNIDPAACRASLAGRPLELTPIEYKILHCLARSRGRVLDRDHILREVSGRGQEVYDRSLDMHISAIRRKLGDSAGSPRFIKTVRGFGYMLMTERD